MSDPALRPEVLACQKMAEDHRVKAEEAVAAAEFWQSLRTDCCTDADSSCDDELCYRAWALYPDG